MCSAATSALVGAGRRHADVDQGDVGAVALDLAIERFGIGGEARDVHAALAQQRGDAVAHDGRVVGDDHADGPAVLALPLRGQHEMTPAQAAQLDLAALLEPDLLLEVGVGLGQLAHDPRDEHLAAVGQVGDPRRLDHRAPVQVVLERHRLAGVQAHPDAQVGRRVERERALDLDRAAQRAVGAGEGEQVTVAQCLDQGAPMAGDALGQHLLVFGEPRQPARLTEALEQGGRTFDVGEDDGDRGTGGSRHPPILTDQGTGEDAAAGRRATPLRVPASATAAATASATPRLNTLGMT